MIKMFVGIYVKQKLKYFYILVFGSGWIVEHLSLVGTQKWPSPTPSPSKSAVGGGGDAAGK